MDLSSIVPYFSWFLFVFLEINFVWCDDDIATTTKEPGLTCAHCATARTITRQKDVLDALEQFLDVRGGGLHFPFDAIDPNCNRPKNISAVRQKRKCLSDYCYSITFRDDQGNPLTLRSCAEYYIPVAHLKGDYCKKLTKKLDITECVCKGTDSCPRTSSAARRHYMTQLLSFLLLSYFAFLRIKWL